MSENCVIIFPILFSYHCSETAQQNVPVKHCKIWYILRAKRPKTFISFCATFYFSLRKALVYVDIDKGIYKGKSKVTQTENQRKVHEFPYTWNMANFSEESFMI